MFGSFQQKTASLQIVDLRLSEHRQTMFEMEHPMTLKLRKGLISNHFKLKALFFQCFWGSPPTY